MSPLATIATVGAGTLAGIALALLTARGYEHLLAAALEHRDRLVEDALNADLDYLDTEYRLLTTHAPDTAGNCSYCGTPAPCITVRALGITTEDA